MTSVQDMAAAAAAARAEAQPGAVLVVVHNFRARSGDELSLSKGDRIELIERDDEFNDGWFLGRHLSTGVTGLFPEVYTTPAPKSSFLSSAGAPRRTSGSMPQAVQAQDIYSTQRPASATTATNHHRTGSGNSMYSKASATTRSSLPSTSESKVLNIPTQSPVMHETLTVIDEHMNDLNPQHTTKNQPRRDTMSSMYSSHPAARMSYIAGHETEDEESAVHTEAEVMRWTPNQVAEYLEDHGVERSHCNVFLEQEITGEVLLAMDQSSLFMKEFDLGLVGRRLRTWHKVKALQDEVRRSNAVSPSIAPSTTTAGAVELPTNEIGRNKSTSAISTSPAVPAPLRNSGGPQTYGQSSITSTPAMSRSNSGNIQGIGLATTSQDTSYRPSAQNVRTMQHWRHSSLDSVEKAQAAHRKQSSIDQQSQTNGRVVSHAHTGSTDTTPYISNHREGLFSSPTQSSPGEVEKGYFSSNEVDSRTRRGKVLQKRQNSTSVSSAHSRNGSFIMYGRKTTPAARAASTDSLQQPNASPAASPMPASSYFSAGATRGASMPVLENKAMNPVGDSGPPVVTKLDYGTNPSAGVTNSPLGANSESPSSANTPHSGSAPLSFFSKTSKIPGMRAISDAVTRSERTSAVNTKEGMVASPTKDGASTPSTGAPSFDMKGSRTSAGSGNMFMPQPTPRKPRTKTKKSTSAYTRGLEKKTPAEQMAGCDYSGWMKKKSGSLMSAWRPRLFVLRGRRLSYYYSEEDTEEKGLIDISFHNVMPAMDEKLISMHAAVTRASGTGNTPTSPRSDGSLVTSAQQDLIENPPQAGSEDENLFIFKLTPPKSGRGVNFTKPTVHYFAVNSRQEGRLWMAALMKAVIDRDQDAVVTTTFNQKTISLAKARAERARPPAFREEDDGFGPTANEERGLGIGVGSPRVNGTVLGGHEEKQRSYMEDASSVATSTVPTTAPSVMTDLSFDIEKEQLAKILQ